MTHRVVACASNRPELSSTSAALTPTWRLACTTDARADRPEASRCTGWMNVSDSSEVVTTCPGRSPV